MLRWAIVGTSFISDTMARAIDASPGSIAIGVVGRDPARLDAFCQRHGIAKVFASVADASADPDIDIVYIGTPNHVHHESVGAASFHLKAVLCEKSLTVSMAQADEVVRAVRNRVFFVEGLMYLAHPVVGRFMEILKDGRIGALKHVSASYVADIAHLVNPNGRGAIYNLGCYPASFVQLVVDALVGDGAFDHHEITGAGNISKLDGNVCVAAATVRFPSGVLATVHTAETYGNHASFEVHGSNGVLAFDTNPWLPARGDNIFRWTPFAGQPEVFVVNDPGDAFDHQETMVERNIAAGCLEAQRPSPRLRDSYGLMAFLTNWESCCRGDNIEVFTSQ